MPHRFGTGLRAARSPAGGPPDRHGGGPWPRPLGTRHHLGAEAVNKSIRIFRGFRNWEGLQMSLGMGKNVSCRFSEVMGARRCGVGAVVDGLPAARHRLADMRRFWAARAGSHEFSTARRETDEPRSSSSSGRVTTGAPSAPSYEPRHARRRHENLRWSHGRPRGLPGFVKVGGANDVRGCGAFSGRMTAPLASRGLWRRSPAAGIEILPTSTPSRHC